MVRWFDAKLWRAVCFLLVSGCSSGSSPSVEPPGELASRADQRYQSVGKLFGEQGLTVGRRAEETGIGVNAYLWRGTLDALASFPLQKADPFGGVIFTDWRNAPGSLREQFKVNVVILSRQLRSDGLKVRIFRREKTHSGGWVQTPAHINLQRHLHEVILLKARVLKTKEQ